MNLIHKYAKTNMSLWWISTNVRPFEVDLLPRWTWGYVEHSQNIEQFDFVDFLWEEFSYFYVYNGKFSYALPKCINLIWLMTALVRPSSNILSIAIDVSWQKIMKNEYSTHESFEAHANINNESSMWC